MATKTFNVSFPDKLAREVDRVAKRQGMTRSELLRIGARQYVRTLSNWERLSKVARARAKVLGIRTEDDVDRMIHEFRAEEAAKRPKSYTQALEGLGAEVWRELGGTDAYIKGERASWGD